jgi:DNA-binding transcriptional LysR family regulator
VESISWHGVVPDSFRHFRERQPDAELQIRPSSSAEQIEAVHAGRLDAGFLFTISSISRELAQLPMASLKLMLAAPKGHPLTKSKSSGCAILPALRLSGFRGGKARLTSIASCTNVIAVDWKRRTSFKRR